MGIVFGYLATICFFILSAKWLTGKCTLVKVNKVLTKIHIPVSFLLVVFFILHIVFVIPVLRNRNILVTISGVVTFLFMTISFSSYHALKQKGRKTKWQKILTMLTIASLVWHIAVYFLDFKEYQRNIENITFKNIEMTEVEDGTYIGEYDAGYIYAKVEVRIENGSIVSINLIEHRNEKGEDAEAILENIVATQYLEVDTVSGATNSSNVIKKAIENAITN